MKLSIKNNKSGAKGPKIYNTFDNLVTWPGPFLISFFYKLASNYLFYIYSCFFLSSGTLGRSYFFCLNLDYFKNILTVDKPFEFMVGI